MNTIKIILICLLLAIGLCQETRGGQTSSLMYDASCRSLCNRSSNNQNDINSSYDYHLQNEVVVLVFKAEWSGQWRMLRAAINELKQDFKNDPVSFVCIDIDTFPAVADFYGVINLPSMLFYRHGKLEENVTVKSKEIIRQMILDLLQKVDVPTLPPVLDNYTLTRNYQYMEGGQYIEMIQYVDGLGRDLLTVTKGITPNKLDLVSLTEYDNLGRKYRSWLPGMLTTTREGINLDSLKNSMKLSRLYSQDANPYSEIKYEPFSREREIKIYNPGKDWHSLDKGVFTEYYLNSTSYPCPLYQLSLSGSSYIISKAGNYSKNVLYVTKSIDEDGSVTLEFVNKIGQLVMTQSINQEATYSTCYIYDDEGNLCVVLSPKAVQLLDTDRSWNEMDVNVKELCYLYKYDFRNRCVAKKLPGVDWLLNVYDCLDRVVMAQDGNLRKEKKWFYYVYDGLDRLIKSNIVLNATNLSRDSIQNLYNVWFNNSYPSQDMDKPLQGNICTLDAKLQETEYDSYDALPSGREFAFKPISNVVVTMDYQVKGLMTKRKLYVLDDKLKTATPNYVEKVYYYDDRARVIQIVTRQEHNSFSRESYKYDFKGNILARHEYHEVNPSRADSLLFTFGYDHASRMIVSKTRLNNGLLASVEYMYDDLGRVKVKRYGDGLKVVNQTMQYNIRGWLEKLSSEMFEMQLRYNNPLLAGTKASYSGNISEWEWQHKAGQNFQTNTYVFSYDSIHRLCESKQYVAGNLNNQYVEKGIQYDVNGNILAMQRTARGTLVDNLSYTYSGNKLISLKESVRTSAVGDIYLPGSFLDCTYAYDLNGNMVIDNRRSLELNYNVLNLLNEVKTTSRELKARYIYLSDGTKLGVRDNNDVNGFDYMGSLTYRKSGAGLQLESASFGEGMIRPGDSNRGQMEVNYFLTDHLGSVRVIVDGSGVVKERNDYYPFGARHVMGDYPKSDNRYKYNGKEEQVTGDLDYLDYGARMYDSGLGRWFGVDPKAEEYVNMSLYGYCANSPIILIDRDGQSYDWYQNLSGDIIYDETIHSREEMNKKGLKGTYLGKTYTSDHTYYSLFGKMMDLRNWEGRLFQKMEKLFMLYANYEIRMKEFEKRVDFYVDEPIEPSVDFNIGMKFNRDVLGLAERNIHEFEYEGGTGYYFNSEGKVSRKGIWGGWGVDKISSNKAFGGQGLKTGYNVNVLSRSSNNSKIVTVVFPSLELKNKFRNKWTAEFYSGK